MTTSTNHPTPELLSESVLAEIEARAEAATKEPWGLAPGNFITADFGIHDPGAGLIIAEVPCQGQPNDENDLKFIACARTDIPALCATVRALREKHTRLAEASDEWASLLDRIRLWSKCADGYPLDEHINNITTQNTALRDQLAQADETNRLAGLQIVELESRLAQVEKERAEQRSMEITAGNWGREED